MKQDLDKNEIKERIGVNLEQVNNLSYENGQLLHLSLGEDNLLLAEIYLSDKIIIEGKSYLEAALDHFILGFRYKKVSLSDRFPKGQIKVTDKLMNPERGLRILMISLVLQDEKRITEAASLILDPPFSEYIGSLGICSYEEQLLAHAYRDFILADPGRDETIKNLDKLINIDSEISTYATILKSLFINDQSEISNYLDDLILKSNESSLNLQALGTLQLLRKKGEISKISFDSLYLSELLF